jgi:glycosyltransferase involved in cell wall biosynthesis
VTAPQFSVILPVYNGSTVVARAIESVRSQTETDWEIVAVDDGSTDSSWEILSEFPSQDQRIRVYRIPNSGGPARPRNTAIRRARGQVICFLDQDDYWLPEKLALQRPLLERPNVGIVSGDAWIEESGYPRRLYSQTWGPSFTGLVAGELIKSNFIAALTAAVPAKVARLVGPLDERMTGVDEYHWWLRISMAGFRVETVDAAVAVTTVTDQNLSHDHDTRLRALELCIGDLEQSYPRWRKELAQRSEELRLHALDYFANRLSTEGAVSVEGIRTSIRVAHLTRSWPETKRLVASAIPPRFRPDRDRPR